MKQRTIPIRRIVFGFAAAALLCCVLRALPYTQAREALRTESFTVCPKPDGDIRTRFLSETFSLQKGIYTVQYDATVPTETEIIVGEAERLRTEDGAESIDAIQCIPLRVPGGSAHREWRIHAERDVEAALLVREYYEGNGVPQAQISCSVVYRPMLSAGCYAVDTLLAFGVLFLLALVVVRPLLSLRQAGRPEAWIPLLLLLLTAFVSLPVFRDYVTYGHDTIFHVRRIASLAEELFAGRIPVRLAQTWKNGYGYPVSIFYGDLWMVPAAVLFRLGVPLFRCYQLLLLMMNTVTVLASYQCFRKISGKPWAGLFLSAMYAGSVRYAANLYLRGAIGEGAGMAVLPLVAVGFWELFSTRERVDRSAVVYLVIGFTALIQVHILTTIQAAVFAALFCLLNIRALLREGRWLSLACAAGLTALLNAWFLVPFLDYYRRHSFFAKQSLSVAETAVKLSKLLEPEETFQAVGAGTLLLFTLSVVMFVVGKVFAKRNEACKGIAEKTERKFEGDQIKRNLTGNTMIVGALSLLAVWMGTDAFPWTFLETKWPALYGLIGGRMQYVWRYFSIATLWVCVTAALVLRWICVNTTSRKHEAAPELHSAENEKRTSAGTDTQMKKQTVMAVAATLLVCMSLYGSYKVQNESFHPKEEKPVLRAADVWNGDGGDALYLFDDLLWYDVPQEMILADDGVVYANVTREGTTFTADVENGTAEDLQISFPVWNYYGYKARGSVEGASTVEVRVKDGEGHRVSVEIPAGFSGHVTVGFREPWYWRAADLVSLLSMIVLAGSVIRENKNKCLLTLSKKPANV